MASGCFSGLWRPHSRARRNYATVPPAPAPNVATQPRNTGGCIAALIASIRPRSHPNPSKYTDVPAPAPSEDSFPKPSGTLAPVLTEVQATGPNPPQGDVGISVPVRVGEVPSESPPSRPVYYLESAKAKKHIDRIDRFRVLVVGRANAGKTTILQRVCNTTDQPEVFNGEGQKVDPTVVQGSIKRGHHNIEDELVFRSNPRFVFHDSCGFEAGSEDQFDSMKRFVMDRARTPKLNKRIHAIWFCIPSTDVHRMVTAAETKFFDECDAGSVPVIVLLTKADTLELQAIEQLEDEELNVDDATKVAALQKEILHNNIAKLKDWLDKLKFPPIHHLALTRMHEENAECTPLLTCTANALSEEGLQELLISTQQTNVGLCMEFAILKTLKKYMMWTASKVDPTVLASMLVRWFPYQYSFLVGEELLEFLESVELGTFQTGQLFGETLPETDKNVPDIHQYEKTLRMPNLATSMQSSMKNITEHGIGALLVFEYLYFLLHIENRGNDWQQDLTFSIKEYQASGVQANVHQLVEEAFEEYGEDVDSLCPILVDIAKKNQMSKKLK